MPYDISLPRINGQNEKEQILQIRDYLYLHAEQLMWALGDLEKGQRTFKKLGDFVTEAGAAKGWTYKKWNGGTFEMFGTFKVTPTSSEKGESLYITDAILIPTPFPITDDAVITGIGEGDYWLAGGAYAAAGAISFKIISDKEIGVADASVVRLRVVGTLQ